MQFVNGGPDVPEGLLQAHEDARVVFFCGAGISYPAGLPSFETLVKKLYSELGLVPDAIQQAAIKARQHDTAVGLAETSHIGGRRAVREAIARILEPKTLKPAATATHDALLTLSKCHKGRTRLVTTNFDRLFERVIDENGHSVQSFEAPLLPVPKKRWNGLVYLHGLLSESSTQDDSDNLVVSSGDFGLAYLTEGWAARFVSELFQNFIVCFVGYSISDPVLRYMTDALAADRLLGESPPEMFAFASYSRGQETSCEREWKAKNVTPILYREFKRHAYLHRTLRAWADAYRVGARGKESIVNQFARANPASTTSQDDLAGRMLWALSDRGGLPAKRFAEMDPVPSLDWLEPLSELRLRHADLGRVGVPPEESVDEQLEFSLLRRPAPYHLAPWMALANAGECSRWDNVMSHLASWLVRHLDNPRLLFWLAKQGGRLHPRFTRMIAAQMNYLAELEQSGDSTKLNQIRKNAPDAIPSSEMRSLWNLFLGGRLEVSEHDNRLHNWWKRFERDGLTAALRLELLEILAPRVSLSRPVSQPPVEWKIVLSAQHIHDYMRGRNSKRHWRDALPALLPDFTRLLSDALDLMRELGGADDRSDRSYIHQPSIGEHEQNSDFRDWTALIDLCRDAWQAMAAESPGQAVNAAEAWSIIPYPLFRRLALFAAAQGEVIPQTKGLEWLLADDGWWLWSTETRRETIRLLVALGPQLDIAGLGRLENAILSGPPRAMYAGELEDEGWLQIQERSIWLLLAKLNDAGTDLGAAAQERLNEISGKYPKWKPAKDERDEFSIWIGDGRELRVSVAVPQELDKLIEWLKQHPETDWRQLDDWRDICRDHFTIAAAALTTLANQGTWPAGRWREALQAWSEDELVGSSWHEMASPFLLIPLAELQQISHGVSWWLEKVAKSIDLRERGQKTFFGLCDRMLGLDYEIEREYPDPVSQAINHEVGLVTRAILHWWFRGKPTDGQGLADIQRCRFELLCNTDFLKFRPGRVLLAAHLVQLFQVDPDWTQDFLFPLFDWQNSEEEARSVWEGFLWSPRLHQPLFEVLKPAFLQTAFHYDRLGAHKERFASLLTFSALDKGGAFSNRELMRAMGELPLVGLEQVAATLADAVDSAGDQRAAYWANRAAPFLKDIWPKSSEVESSSISESFCLACMAAGDAFPEALSQVRPWLMKATFPDRVLDELHDTRLDDSFPEHALEVMHLVVADNAKFIGCKLKACLTTIREKQPELESELQFRRLLEILKANEEDLD